MEIDRIHFYVLDAAAWRDWFVNRMGFRPAKAHATDDTRTEIINKGGICFMLCESLNGGSPVAEYLKFHPPGVADVGFRVRDLDSVLKKVTDAGAKVLEPVRQQQTATGYLKRAKIAGWGSLTHTLTEAENQREKKRKNNSNFLDFAAIDHAVLNVAAGDLERALSFYEQTLGFRRQQKFNIQTGRSGLYSQVLIHPDGKAQLPVNEPTSANSQIQEFLDANRGAGIQHLAIKTNNITQIVRRLRQNGVSFLSVPSSYYDSLLQRRKDEFSSILSPEEWREIIDLQILVDWQEDKFDALLLQIFTRPLFGEPTFFFEIIDRREQARGFGEGNFTALFEAVEREQMKRQKLPRISNE
ncbi:MAG: 4-hydroxyphenylpyruvate dioxygenase [Cyanobacteriota bacterium]|nr:4-hydroxyphenylpyruvate dioxygenase [Cyanobacteriota bacterium]